MGITSFNIRVYMLLVDESGTQLLLSDEIVGGNYYTKFPGGGLEYGEGILDCLHREALEELGQDVDVIGHFYTTEFFQASMFKPEDQIIAVYYKCRLAKDADGRHEAGFRISDKAFDFIEYQEREECFRWTPVNTIEKEDLSLPIDQVVVSRLKKEPEYLQAVDFTD